MYKWTVRRSPTVVRERTISERFRLLGTIRSRRTAKIRSRPQHCCSFKHLVCWDRFSLTFRGSGFSDRRDWSLSTISSSSSAMFTVGTLTPGSCLSLRPNPERFRFRRITSAYGTKQRLPFGSDVIAVPQRQHMKARERVKQFRSLNQKKKKFGSQRRNYVTATADAARARGQTLTLPGNTDP